MNNAHWSDDNKPSSTLLWWLILAFAAFVAWASFFEINHARISGKAGHDNIRPFFDCGFLKRWAVFTGPG